MTGTAQRKRYLGLERERLLKRLESQSLPVPLVERPT